MTETIVTDGVLRVTGEGVTIDGRPGNVAYLIPPCDPIGWDHRPFPYGAG